MPLTCRTDPHQSRGFCGTDTGSPRLRKQTIRSPANRRPKRQYKKQVVFTSRIPIQTSQYHCDAGTMPLCRSRRPNTDPYRPLVFVIGGSSIDGKPEDWENLEGEVKAAEVGCL
ncbi:hypothetical protein EG329_003662 [Mollisiaceae sp. DMI_Dod_QoI]|nr:hypothetical protein EG329_003662 [Helotiales sp. DMI_Dod_QoI]